jgi:site-specific recombinase XerD
VRRPGTRDGLTKVQAEQKLQKMIEADAPSTNAKTRVQMPEAGDALVRRLTAQDRKKSYIETVESIVRVHLVPAREFAGKDLARITEDDIERYIARKREGKDKLAAKTIRNHLGTLHSLFELGQRRKWCADNPVKLAEGPKVRRNRTRIRFLTPVEVEALCRAPYPR